MAHVGNDPKDPLAPTPQQWAALLSNMLLALCLSQPSLQLGLSLLSALRRELVA